MAAPVDNSANARAVRADALLERGDPLGEFMLLQLKDVRGEATAAQQRRARSLLKTYRTQWLGPLAPVLTHVVFRAGVLERAALARNDAGLRHQWVEAAECPQLSTVRALFYGRSNEGHYRRFLSSPTGGAIEAIDVPSTRFLEWLLATGISTRITTVWLKQPLSRAARQLLGATTAFPLLRRLVLAANEPAMASVQQQLGAGPLGEQRVAVQQRGAAGEPNGYESLELHGV